jgi:hypothetical protein
MQHVLILCMGPVLCSQEVLILDEADHLLAMGFKQRCDQFCTTLFSTRARCPMVVVVSVDCWIENALWVHPNCMCTLIAFHHLAAAKYSITVIHIY